MKRWYSCSSGKPTEFTVWYENSARLLFLPPICSLCLYFPCLCYWYNIQSFLYRRWAEKDKKPSGRLQSCFWGYSFPNPGGRRSKYCSPAEKKAVAEYANIHGASAAARKFNIPPPVAAYYHRKEFKQNRPSGMFTLLWSVGKLHRRGEKRRNSRYFWCFPLI